MKRKAIELIVNIIILTACAFAWVYVLNYA